MNMNWFKDHEWQSRFVTTTFVDRHGSNHETAHYVISDWKIPFTFEDWQREVGFNVGAGPEAIYEYCSDRLTRPFCKEMVLEAATRLECDPGYVQPYEKMASFYILRLLAGIDRKEVWQQWSKIPMTEGLLKDEVFCLCLMALHPVLYGKLHPFGRNNRRVALEALARWDLPKYSMLQFVHPYAMREFGGQTVPETSIGLRLQAHKPVDAQYWLFDDASVVCRAIGVPGKRRWHELEYVGPTALGQILRERKEHNSSLSGLREFVNRNVYCPSIKL